MAAAWTDVDLSSALITAEGAYGASVRRDLAFALDRFSNEAVRARCVAALAIDDEATLDAGLGRLASLIDG